MGARNKAMVFAAVMAALPFSAAAQQTGESQSQLSTGIAHYLAGRPDEALEPLRQALKLNPASLPAAQYLGASLAETGRCQEAVPYLSKPVSRTAGDRLRKAIGVDRVKCAMALNRIDEAAEAMRLLNRAFPADPEVLYLAVHVYSDLSIRASQELLFKAPESYQVHQLNAEALETQGKWEEAASEYRAVLQKNPNAPGIHYRLGRLLLSQPKTATTMQDARREFEEELRLNPANAGAEFVLGELARQADQWPDAITHFSRATKLDAGFADAYIGLGRSLLAAERVTDAVPPLETAAKLQPDNPATHFHLATAYRRAGRKDDADREFIVHRQTSEKARATTDTIQKGVLDGLSAKPPQ
jgi:tetratricopeptide (TPR) repeat protein